MAADTKAQLEKLGISEPVDNAKLIAVIQQVAEAAGVWETGCSKEVGTLLYKLATHPKGKALPEGHRAVVARHVGARTVNRNQQLDAAMAYLVAVDKPDENAFKEACGVGVEVSEAEVAAAANELVQAEREAIAETRYRTNVGMLVRKLQAGPQGARLKWAEGATVKRSLDAALEALLGPKTAEDLDPKAGAKTKTPKTKTPKAGAGAPAGGSNAEAAQAGAEGLEGAERHFPKPEENFGEAPYGTNSKEMLQKHLACTGGIVVTRFPPEPNGYLHIGHAKAMNMNFGFARRAGGKTILRYDDTNPEAEEHEFFDMIENEVKWLGHAPAEVTFSSTHFETLYQLAVRLIESGDAYVCHQTAEQVKASRAALVEAHHAHAPVPEAAKSPWRDRCVEENKRWFLRMRSGRVAEGEAFLRFKGDLSSSNPNMWDLAAYRVKFTPHPAAGRGWCIYPTYDFTHCIIDSIENVTHSLCTLEFESRQAPDGSYYWLLDKLGLYKPATWEYARLNITYTVLSKRKLNKLVTDKYVNGWDDPRLLTLAGLRRRGFSADMINKFCEQIGVTRSDGVVTHYEVLEGVARTALDASAVRRMAVLRPLRVVIANLAEAPGAGPRGVEVVAKNHPKDEAQGTRTLTLTPTIYIDGSDFRLEDDPNYYGLAPGKEVGLKHAGLFLRCTEVITGPDGEPAEVRATIDPASATRAKKEQPKGVLQWVPEGGAVALAEVRLYERLFTVPNVNAEDDWLARLNPKSLEVVRGAMAEKAVGQCKPGDALQFERIGFFVCDPDSGNAGKVFNRTITLKESKEKAK